MASSAQARLVEMRDAAALSDFHRRNAGHLSRWEPRRDPDYHTVAAWQARLEAWATEPARQQAAHFVSVDSGTGEIIATCALTGISGGAFQACHMGYAVDARHEGCGQMRTLCEYAIAYAFSGLGLNRVMAAYMPANQRSARLLARLGFEREGLARRYLNINGRWEDHVLTSRLNPDRA